MFAGGETRLDELPVIAVGVVGAHHRRRQALVAVAEAEGLVAGGELVAGLRRGVAFLRMGNAERFEIGLVGEEDAGVFRAEGMAGIGGHGEAEPLDPGARGGDVGDRENEMVERANGHRRFSRFRCRPFRMIAGAGSRAG